MRFVRWIVGGILCFYGIALIVGCIAYLVSGESKTSIWADLGLVLAFGVVPLAGGIMLLLMSPGPFEFLLRRAPPNEGTAPNCGPATSAAVSAGMKGPQSLT